MQINWNITSPKQQNNNYQFLLTIFGIAALILSWQFAVVRVLYQDEAFLFFRITNQEQMVADHYRYGAMLFQLPGWIAIKLGASLKTVAYILSLSYVLIPLAISQILLRKNHQSVVPIAILALFTFTGPNLFFLGMLEIIPGFTYSLLFYYLIAETQIKFQLVFKFLFGSILLAAAISSHPSLVFLLGFLIVFNSLDLKEKIEYKKLIWIVPLGLIFWLKTKLISGNPYEENFIKNIRFDGLKELTSYWSWSYFSAQFTKIYLPLTILSTLTVLNYFSTKKYLRGLVYIGGLLSTTIFLLMVYKDGDAEALMEKSFSILVPMAIIPFAKDILFKSSFSSILKHIFLAWAFIYCLSNTLKKGVEYEATYQKMEILMNRNDLKSYSKILIPIAMTKTTQWQAGWALPYESLCYSAIKDKGQAKTIKQYKELPDSSKLSDSGIFFGPDFVPIAKINSFNKKYYKLSETEIYHIIK